MVTAMAMTLTISDAASASGVSAHTLRYYKIDFYRERCSGQ
jgi:hypothetical protein